jgi:glycosyltransferase involved in cell wall biosynthesis
MKILFIHQNFPGQFKFLASKLAKLGHEVRALTVRSDSKSAEVGVEVRKYQLVRSSIKDQNPLLQDFETKIIRAESCLLECLKLKETEYSPDVVIAHAGWGESLFIKECWPRTKLGIYCEYFYRFKGGDVGFDKEIQPNVSYEESKLRLKNINNRLHFEIADSAISPTQWQADTYPSPYREKITVIHDGIDTKKCAPDQHAYLIINKAGEELRLTKGDEVITFVNRNLEPYRGFHIFMRAIPKILQAIPNAKVLIIGGSKVSYGFAPEKARFGFDNWKDIFINEVAPNLSEQNWKNIYFLGHVEYQNYLNILQISMVHVYLTYPFVLSWSMLESMSVGCALVASNTPPVQEVVINGFNGELVDFFDHQELADKVISLINDPEKRNLLSKNARQTIVDSYDLETVCLPKQINWVQNLYEQFIEN